MAKNGSKVQQGFDFQPFPELDAAVKSDIQFLKGHEALAKGVEFSGWVYEVETGRVRQVVRGIQALNE